jgi:hypothetical protein
MADKKAVSIADILLSAAKAKKEEKRFFKAADKQRRLSKTLLHPTDVAGEYDVARGLLTLLGGTPRLITTDDLRKFQTIVQSKRKKFRQGITAKGVIDLAQPIPPQTDSGPTDQQRANSQIKMAPPISHIGGKVRFMTNAGPGSDRQRHYVTVEFINYEAITASAIPLAAVAREIAKSPLKIGCDCGRWRF